MITRKIKWKGPKGYTAKIGPTVPDEEITVEGHVADELIAAGLAEAVPDEDIGAVMIERPSRSKSYTAKASPDKEVE